MEESVIRLEKVSKTLRDFWLRPTVAAVEALDPGVKRGAKIREASAWKVPYKLVVGPRDEASGTVSVRKSGEGDLGAMTIDDFVAKIRGELEP